MSQVEVIDKQMFCFSSGGFDLAMMVDASSSVGGQANFQLTLEFVKSVYRSFMTGYKVRYALVVFGNGHAKVTGSFSILLCQKKKS